MAIDSATKRASGFNVGLPWRGSFPIEAAAAATRSYSPESVAAFAQMDVQPTLERKASYDDVIGALVAANIWSYLDVFYLLAAHSEQAALLNLRDPVGSYNGRNSGSVFVADLGFIPDGVAAEVNTGFDPFLVSSTSHFQQDSAAIGFWCESSVQTSTSPVGSATTTTNATIITPRNTSDQFTGQVNASSGATITNTDAQGFYAIDRSGASTTTYYKNGVSVGTSSVSSGTPADNLIKIGKQNSSFQSSIASALFISSSFSAAQHALIYSAIQGYMNDVIQ